MRLTRNQKRIYDEVLAHNGYIGMVWWPKRRYYYSLHQGQYTSISSDTYYTLISLPNIKVTSYEGCHCHSQIQKEEETSG